MNPTYSAVEYFINVLRKNSTFSVNYHSFHLLIEQAPKEVASYFRNQKENDPFCIFKKFPDVFVLDGSTITLTDAFLSLFAFPLSAEFRSNKVSRDVFESAAIEYFKLILVRCGSMHFSALFNVLLNQKDLWLTQFYLSYSEAEKLKFFQMHSDSFAVSNSVVYLKMKPFTTAKSLETSECDKAFKKLSQSTCFLLSCFDSLHYLELKQIISFVFENVRDYLNSFSLIQQRLLFESLLSEATMNNKGFLTLKNHETAPSNPKSKKLRLILLIVCILSFERHMHFQKIVNKVSRRVSSSLSSLLCKLSVSEQFQFFVDLSDYFVILNNGHVMLTPRFVFPMCTFEDNVPYSQTSALSFQPASKPTSSVATDLPSNFYSDVNLSHSGQNAIIVYGGFIETSALKICNRLTLQICNFSTSFDLPNLSGNLDIVEHQLAQLLKVHSISDRLKAAVVYLMACFVSPLAKSVLECCLYVMDDVLKGFSNLSHVEKQCFVQEYCNFFEKVSQVKLTCLPVFDCICSQEKVKLFIVYALSKVIKGHFESLTYWINYCKIGVDVSCWKSPLIYFRQLSNWVTIGSDGYIICNDSFKDVDLMISPFFAVVSQVSACMPDSTTNDKNWEELAVSDDAAASSKLTMNETEIPSKVRNKIQLALYYLRSFSDHIIAVHFLETCLHALDDVQSYFLSLSTLQQQRFVESFFRSIDGDSVFTITLEMSEVSNSFLSAEDDALLTITYLLTEVQSAHYENIVKKLETIGISYALCKMKAKERFKHFKSFNKYFTIDGTGFVSLSSSFFVMRSALKNISASCLEAQGKMKRIIKGKFEEVNLMNAKESKDVSLRCVSPKPKKLSSPPISVNVNDIPRCPSPKPKKLSSPTISINVNDIIVDLSVLKLSICEKMKIDKLNKLLHYSGVKPVQNVFSYETVTVIKNFFVDIPECFEVTRDDFIGLKKGVLTSYEPRTNIIVRDSKGGFLLNKTSNLIDYSGPDFVMSGSEVSTTSSSSSKKRVRTKKGSNQKQPNKSEKCLSSVAKENLQKVTTKEETFSSINHETVSNGVQNNTKNLASNTKQNSSCPSSDEQFNENRNISPSTVESSESSSRAVSVTSIPERITVTFRPECNSRQVRANLDNGQSCDNASTKYLSIKKSLPDSGLSKATASSLPRLACSRAKFQVPRQPHKEKNSLRNPFCDATKNNVSSIGDLATGVDHSKTFASSLPELENGVSQMDIKDLNPFLSYGEELISAFLADAVCVSSNGRSDDRKPAKTSSPHVFDDGFSIHSSSPDTPVVHKPEYSDMPVKPGDYQTLSVLPAASANKVAKSDSLLPEPSSGKSSDIDVEFKAVNFFAAILGNYVSGASASFLVRHLNRASPEVETFMREHYRKNLLSFFMKHKNVFCVLPDSDQIYLVREK